ncbi:DNA/RNA nuclease SfsA [Caldisalinibacter kiritimatiensis]|uniref:Sugar fermentation stimulation protein homolog n=1 Tax=Caldisalinibacter kiritimatiensis TaxID=1304284 RepID=R1AS35_9FIRM|nr:DNA/RNA nuclease SfsA [Caldisalinibacter kiritimatiensis]EOC99947.1 Sugar/maltose fermentation stimulation protein [Caldisalinibacter kiritimatiensis]
MKLKIDGNILEGYFHRRVNRFIAEVYINNKLEKAHVPNTGRMKELLVEGAKVLVRKVEKTERKTKFDLLMVYYNNILVNIDSKIPNILLYKGFQEKKLNYFKEYNEVKREVTYGNSRFDIGLIGKENALIEAKCVTFVRNKIAMFPDAPTKRGVKHINELIKATKEGVKTAVFFIIQRDDAEVFMPNWEMDKEFSSCLRKAYNNGVKIVPLICKVTRKTICIDKEIDIKFKKTGG